MLFDAMRAVSLGLKICFIVSRATYKFIFHIISLQLCPVLNIFAVPTYPERAHG